VVRLCWVRLGRSKIKSNAKRDIGRQKQEGLRYINTCRTVERRPLSKEQIIQLSKEVCLVFRGQMPEAKMNSRKSTVGRAR
jgi:hypothetical protein